MILSVLLILEMKLVVYNIVHHNAEPHKVKEGGHLGILDVHVSRLVAIECPHNVAGQLAKLEVLPHIFTNVSQRDITNIVVGHD